MAHNKSSDDPLEIKIIVALLRDVQTSCSDVYSSRSCRLDTEKVKSRFEREGLSFLTKTLPRLAKALDRALTGETQIDAISLRLAPQRNSQLPMLMGELFNSCFTTDGVVLLTPCINSIIGLRNVLYCFYKYKLPYNKNEENEVISQFKKTESDIATYSSVFTKLAQGYESARELRLNKPDARVPNPKLFETIIGSDMEGSLPDEGAEQVRCQGLGELYSPRTFDDVVRRARCVLSNIFSKFDCHDILPRHGPGAVSTKEKLWDKYHWSCVPERITRQYPLDAYFYASLGAVCDKLGEIKSLPDHELSARVILVPKDSRGPRLISCEPLAFQWIQQGLHRAIVDWLESHPLTRWNIHFTDQQPNRLGALLGSKYGRYSTLDLKEASDRVSMGLVRLLFPEHLVKVLEASRTLTTELPGGEILALDKFAPMGSALCFPILATTIWTILSAGAPDAETRDGLLVYGDDVIVPTAYAENAIKLLESFGLLVNRDKSCTKGSFRESCGMDAFKGINVTPVRIKTVWASSRRPDIYSAYIDYSNQYYARCYFNTYNVIVQALHSIYGAIPDMDMGLPCPSLAEVPEAYRPKRRRVNKHLQRCEVHVWTVRSRTIKREIDGWSMLLRSFAEGGSSPSLFSTNDSPCRCGVEWEYNTPSFSVREYTRRGETELVKVWAAGPKPLDLVNTSWR